MFSFLQQKNSTWKRRKYAEGENETSAIKSTVPIPRSLNARIAPIFTKSTAPEGEVVQVSLHLASDQEKLQMSVCLIDDIRPFDKGEPHPHGLYDLRLGPLDMKHTCQTCNGNIHQCPKHVGHTIFFRYKYSVCFVKTIYMLLNTICHNCGQI